MDSYDKLAYDMLRSGWSNHTRYVAPSDRVELMSKIAPVVLDDYYEYMDNIRIADSLNYHQYKKIKKQGCCGFVDRSVVLSNGKRYFYGFNYGH